MLKDKILNEQIKKWREFKAESQRQFNMAANEAQREYINKEYRQALDAYQQTIVPRAKKAWREQIESYKRSEAAYDAISSRESYALDVATSPFMELAKASLATASTPAEIQKLLSQANLGSDNRGRRQAYLIAAKQRLNQVKSSDVHNVLIENFAQVNREVESAIRTNKFSGVQSKAGTMMHASQKELLDVHRELAGIGNELNSFDLGRDLNRLQITDRILPMGSVERSVSFDDSTTDYMAEAPKIQADA